MKLMKVFDCQDMPQDIRKNFFEFSEAHNDCYIDWFIGDAEPHLALPEVLAIDKWLIANGGKDEEHVIIKHWW